MKKIMMVAIALIASTSFTSCSNPQDKLMSKVETMVQEQLIPNLKDPKSFEKKEIKLDTVTTKMYLNNLVELNNMDIDHNIRIADIWVGTDNSQVKENLDKNIPLKEKNDSLLNLLKVTSDTSIARINIKYSYRAKNGFGALDIHTANLTYVPSEDKLSLWKD
jgi:hypothetical protein